MFEMKALTTNVCEFAHLKKQQQ